MAHNNIINRGYTRRKLLLEMRARSETSNVHGFECSRSEVVVDEYVSAIGMTPNEAESYILLKEKGFRSFLIKVAFKYKEIIKKIPIIGKKILRKKERMLNNSLDFAEHKKLIDVSHILQMDFDSFLVNAYRILLEREIDSDGLFSHKQNYRLGATKESIVYLIISSDEFANRRFIKDYEKYKNSYKVYKRTLNLYRIPIIGKVYKLLNVPNKLDNMFSKLDHMDLVIMQNIENMKLTSQMRMLHLENKLLLASDQSLLLEKKLDMLSNSVINIYESIHTITGDVHCIAEDIQCTTEDVRGITEDVRGITEDVRGITEDVRGITEDVQSTTEDVRRITKDVQEIAADIQSVDIEMKENFFRIDESNALIQERINNIKRDLHNISMLSNTIDSISEVKEQNKQLYSIQAECANGIRNNSNHIEQVFQYVSNLQSDVQSLGERDQGALVHEIRDLMIERFSSSQEIGLELTKTLNSSMMVSTSISEKIDALPQFITANSMKTKSSLISIPGAVTSVIVNDFILGLPSEEWGLAMTLSCTNHFERGTEICFEGMLKEGMTVIDIGANLGIYSLIALRKKCNVYSYEPTPSTFNLLNRNIKVNGFLESGRAHTFNKAVSDKNGIVELSIVDGICGHNNIYGEFSDKNVEVSVVSLDNHLEELDQVDIIKIDIEGAEFAALRGMTNLLHKNPAVKIFMEFAPLHLRRAGVEPEDLLELIESLNYNYGIIDETNGTVRVVDCESLLQYESVNLLLTKSA